MVIRYMDDDGSIKEVFEEVRKKYFKNLTAKIKFMFDTKKKSSSGKLVLARCKLANEMLRYLTQDEIEEGYDYFIIVDKTAWDIAEEDDKIRLLRHELRHIYIDEKGNYKLAPHDIEDFLIEIELNKDKPDWRNNLATMVDIVYDQNKND